MCTNKHSQLLDCWPLIMCILLKLRLSYCNVLQGTRFNMHKENNPYQSSLKHPFLFISFSLSSISCASRNHNLNLRHLASSYKSSPTSHNYANLDNNILNWSWFLKCWKFVQIQSKNIHQKKQENPNFGNLEINVWRFWTSFHYLFILQQVSQIIRKWKLIVMQDNHYDHDH
jgi:hypothetical protein